MPAKKPTKYERAERAFDRLSVKAVSRVMREVNGRGELLAYDGIEAAREIKAMFLRAYARLSK